MSVEKQQEKGSHKRLLFVTSCVVVYALLFCIICSTPSFMKACKNMTKVKAMKNTTLVLYEGPKSLKDATAEDLEKKAEKQRDITLKHCVDTKIFVNGQESYVYDTNVNNTHTWISTYTPALERTPITYFDFDGAVEITIEVPEVELESVVVRPLAYDIKPTVDKKKHTVSFFVTEPDAYTVEFNNSVERAVHIFANPLEENVPDFEDEDVKYIGPGEWNVEDIVLEDNQTLYIAGGAVVHGTVCANYASNVTVCGRGILDGSFYDGWAGHSAHVPLTFNNCQYVALKDIICLNSNAWGVQTYDVIGGEIDNLKMITARPNGDGLSIQSCKDMNIHDCFIRTWDDSLVVKNYDRNSSRITFDNIQVWTDLAQSMEIGFETNKGKKENSTITDVSFKNITVLHNLHKPVISIHNGDDAAVSEVLFESIVVEDARMGMGDGVNHLMELQVLYNSGWSSTKERGTISNVVIDGLKVIDGNDATKCVIEGFDEAHGIDGVTIKNFEYKGKKISSVEDELFSIDKRYVQNITVE